MTLSEFKFIFFWEYLHRMIGRCIGLAAVLPFLYFLVKKQLSARFTRRWLIIIALIGCQGLMGWFMVKSGLVDNPHVSHFRLAAHLSLAFLIFSLMLKEYLTLTAPKKAIPIPINYWRDWINWPSNCLRGLYRRFKRGKILQYLKKWAPIGSQMQPSCMLEGSSITSSTIPS